MLRHAHFYMKGGYEEQVDTFKRSYLSRVSVIGLWSIGMMLSGAGRQ
jgi:hypothetical protein